MKNRIAERRETLKISQRELGRLADTTGQMIGMLERGERSLDLDWLKKIAAALRCRPVDLLPTELLAGTDISPDVPPSAPCTEIDDFVSIPRYDAALSAGPGSIVDPNAEPLGRYFFEAQWLAALTRAAGDQLAVVRVDGDSMEPALSDGDWVLIDRTQRRINRPGVYAIQVGDTAWIKRITLNLRARLVQVISDNSVYPMQELEEGELSIIGRAIWIVGRKI